MPPGNGLTVSLILVQLKRLAQPLAVEVLAVEVLAEVLAVEVLAVEVLAEVLAVEVLAEVLAVEVLAEVLAVEVLAESRGFFINSRVVKIQAIIKAVPARGVIGPIQANEKEKLRKLKTILLQRVKDARDQYR